MATVRFSEKLKDDIERNAKDMFKKELKALEEKLPATWTAEYIYNTIFSKDIRDKMNALPDKFMDTTSRIDFAGFRNVGEGEDRRYWGLSYDIQLTFNTPVRMPQGSTFDDFHKSWRDVTLNLNVPQYATIQAEFKTWRDAQWVVIAKKDKFIDGIKQIMNTYSTLSPALKVFPALWDLVPEEAQERHMKVVSRKKGEVKELGDLDVNSLTATVTFNKLTK